jgi:TRAP-type transport system periplasmic protein
MLSRGWIAGVLTRGAEGSIVPDRAMRLPLVVPFCVAAIAGASIASPQTSTGGVGKAGPAAGPLKIRVSHVYSEDHPWQKSFERFQELVQTKSNGAMEVQIFANHKLCMEKECVSLLRSGVLDVTAVSANGIEDLVPEVTFLDLLFLFKDRDHWRRAFEGSLGKRMTELIRKSTAKGGEKGFEVLGWWGGSEVNVLSRKGGYEVLADLEGTKIRVQDSALQFDLWKALGAIPISLPMDKIRGGLQDGVVDAVPLSNPTAISAKEGQRFYEVAPHVTEMRIAVIARPLLISGRTWAKLTPAQREIVRDAAREATDLDHSLEAELSDGAIEKMKTELPGTKVYTFKDRYRMRERLRPVQERYAAQLGLLDLLASLDQDWDKTAPAEKAPRPKK